MHHTSGVSKPSDTNINMTMTMNINMTMTINMTLTMAATHLDGAHSDGHQQHVHPGVHLLAVGHDGLVGLGDDLHHVVGDLARELDAGGLARQGGGVRGVLSVQHDAALRVLARGRVSVRVSV